MFQGIYPDYHGKTLDWFFQCRLEAGDTTATALSYLDKQLRYGLPATEDSPFTPHIDTTPPLPEGWRLVEVFNTVGVLFPDGNVLPGTNIWLHARDWREWRGKRYPILFGGGCAAVLEAGLVGSDPEAPFGFEIIDGKKVPLGPPPEFAPLQAESQPEISPAERRKEENKLAIELVAQELKKPNPDSKTREYYRELIKNSGRCGSHWSPYRFETHVWKQARKRARLDQKASGGRRPGT